MNNFYHSGATGDVIYAMPTIKALGGGIFNVQLPDHLYDTVLPLLESQEYIYEVKKGREFVGNVFNLDKEASCAKAVGLILVFERFKICKFGRY